MALASGAPAHAEPNHYARNDDYRDFGELWILLSALEHFQRDGDKLRSVSSLLQSWSASQRASMTALKEALISLSCKADTAENQIQNLIVQAAEITMGFAVSTSFWGESQGH